MVATLQRDGITVAVASQPFLYRDDLGVVERRLLYFPQIFCAENGAYPSVLSMVAGMRRFNDAARAIAKSAQASYLDFERAVPKTREYFSDDVHLRAAGNDVLAKLAYNWIVARGLISGRSPGAAATWRRWRPYSPSAPASLPRRATASGRLLVGVPCGSGGWGCNW